MPIVAGVDSCPAGWLAVLVTFFEEVVESYQRDHETDLRQVAAALAFLGNVAAFIGSIPTPVIGGIAIALFGAIAAAGSRQILLGPVTPATGRPLPASTSVTMSG